MTHQSPQAYCGVGCVLEPVLLVPLGPVTVPVVVDVPFPLLTVVPLTVVVPPLGPVTVPFSVVPVRVLVTEPVADAVFPRAPLAVPVPVTVLPVREAEPVAVEPLRPVTVFCAKADVQARDRARMLSTDSCFI